MGDDLLDWSSTTTNVAGMPPELQGEMACGLVWVFRIAPQTGDSLILLATAIVGDGGWVDLANPIIVPAGGPFRNAEDARWWSQITARGIPCTFSHFHRGSHLHTNLRPDSWGINLAAEVRHQNRSQVAAADSSGILLEGIIDDFLLPLANAL
jgi:hypothetical protein